MKLLELGDAVEHCQNCFVIEMPIVA